MQKTAYDDLENALNGSFNQEQLLQQQQMMSPGADGRHTPMKAGSIGSSNNGRP